MARASDDEKASSDEVDANNHGERPRRSGLRRLLIAAQVLVGLGLGAVITEYVFSARDDGAFPHANFYVADPELGVRLEPGATMRFQLRPNPVSTIHVNSAGYRGGEWPAASADEIIVVGDSQVFGLGVDDDATFSSVLAQKTGRTVINAGVPTYGPAEYRAIAGELLAARGAKTVVVVVNFANDPFEIDRPNRERHAVWDGWAVRSETAPEAVSEFPGRRWLFSRSHAVYALRRWLHERGTASAPEDADLGDPIDLGTPSEGVWQELVEESKRAHDDALTRAAAASTTLSASKERLAKIDDEIVAKRDDLDDLIIKASAGEFTYNERRVARGTPGDIIDDNRSEASRSVQLTAAMIRKAGQAREKHLKALLAQEAKKGVRKAEALLQDAASLAAERSRLRAELAAGAAAPPGAPAAAPPPSLFHDYLTAVKALCDQHGAELVVVALPIDVQVDPAEWAKYGIKGAPDMRESMILIDDLIADAATMGLRALDGTDPLREAEPGAFLDHDIHMTAKGHEALAGGLQAALAAPLVVALKTPAPGLPERRSFAPAADEWAAGNEVKVKGSTAAGCTTQIQREWLRVQCRRERLRDRFDAIEVVDGGAPATMTMRTADSLSLVTPLTIGVDLSARFYWKGAARELQIRWPAGDDGNPKFVGEFVDLKGVAAPAPAPVDPAVLRLCACHETSTHERFCEDPGDYQRFDTYDSSVEDCHTACGGLYGDPALIPACELAFPDRVDPPEPKALKRPPPEQAPARSPAAEACARRIACVQSDPLAAPACPEGQVHAFTSNACFALCDGARPCAAGECTPWQGAGVCVGAG